MGEKTTDKGTRKMKRQRARQEKGRERYGVRDKDMEQRDEEGVT